MVEQGMRDEEFQANIILYIDYCYVPHYIDMTNQKYIPRLIAGCKNINSYFATIFVNVYVQ